MDTQSMLLLGGSVVIFLWGVGHLLPTRNVVDGFGSLSLDNRRIITMEWLLEGLTLCFLGLLVACAVSILGADADGTRLVAVAVGVMLFVMAGVSTFTGARTAVVPMKMCPFVKSAVAVSYAAAAIM